MNRERLDRLPKEASKYFVTQVLRLVPRCYQQHFFYYVLEVEWGIKPPSPFDMLYPSADFNDAEMVSSLTELWGCDDAVRRAELLQLVRLVGCVENVHYDRGRWYNIILNENKFGEELSELVLLQMCPCRNGGRPQLLRAVAGRLSGSQREGVWCYRNQGYCVSDTDWLVELGPSQLLARLSAEPTDHTGYVLLRLPGAGEKCDRPDCDGGFLSAERLRTALKTHLEPKRFRKIEAEPGGASVEIGSDNNRTPFLSTNNADHVLCVPQAEWPADKYRNRQTYRGHVTQSMVERIATTNAYLVTKGFPGSETEQHQFRISFSQQEYILMRLLSVTHREVLIMLKLVKSYVGERLSAVKSYYLKTCLLWVAEESAECRVDQLLEAVMARLLTAARTGNLPNYFWADINLLAPLTKSQLQKLRQGVHLMQQILLPSLNIAVYTEVLVQRLTYGPRDRAVTSRPLLSRLLFRAFYLQYLTESSTRCFLDQAWHLSGAAQRLAACDLSARKQHVMACTRKRLNTWAGYLVQVLAFSDDCKVTLTETQTPQGTRYWIMDLTWFFDESRRELYVPGLDEVNRALLLEQSRLPAERRLPGVTPELCTFGVYRLSGPKLAQLYLQQGHLVNSLAEPDMGFLTQRMVSQHTESWNQLVNLLSNTADHQLVDHWMPENVPP